MSDLTLSSSATMTSKEIAELTDKEHKNVLRDIDNLLKTLGSDLSRGFSMTYEGNPAHGYRVFHLDRDSTFCLMAGYDAVARMRIIKRWQALESGEATPAFALTPQEPIRPSASKDPRLAALGYAKLAMQAARAFGFKGNMATLSADNAVRNLTGVSPLALMDATALRATAQEMLLIVKEVGERLGWAPRTTNPRITESGLQTEYRDANGKLCYELTEIGRTYGVYVDSNRRHSNGTLIRSVKWQANVVEFLRGRYPVSGSDQ